MVFLASGLAASSLVGAATVRWDDPAQPGQHPFLEGSLVSNSGSLQIKWETGAASQDNVPARPDAATEDDRAQKFVLERHFFQNPNGFCGVKVTQHCSPTYDQMSGYDLVEKFPTDTFTSDGVPRDLYVNVTRGFMLTLYLQNNPKNKQYTGADLAPCMNKSDYFPSVSASRSSISWFEPTNDVELYADGKIIGGGYYNDAVSWTRIYPLKAKPTPPAGYTACYYQMHSEARVIPQGAVLTLKILHARQQYWYPYGLAGDHHSNIRIWEYPQEEIIFRNPELLPDDAVDGGSDPGASDPAPSGGGLAVALPALVALAVAPLTSRRRGGALVAVAALLITSAGLAGCLTGGGGGGGDASDAMGGRIQNSQVKDTNAILGFGSILGTVHDDLHVPLKGVHVSLIGLGNFTATDSKGHFKFPQVIPGNIRLRFDLEQYKSFETDVEIKAGFASTPDITMLLKDAKERDFRPHSHDYWDGAPEKSLGDVTMAERCTSDATATTCLPPIASFYLIPTDTDANTVLPGTGTLKVTLTWDAAMLKADRLGLYLYSRQGNGSTFAPRASGVPFIIPTTWEMTDNGHALYSSWSFAYILPVSEERTYEEEREIEAANYHWGNVAAKTLAVRGGTLPMEPAHVDPWGTATTLQNIKGATLYHYAYGDTPPSAGLPYCVYAPTGQGACPGAASYYYPVTPNLKKVADGTQWVEVTVTPTRIPDPQWGIKLYYKPANVHFSKANYQTLQGFTGVDATAGSSWSKFTFKFKVTPEQADGIYATSSAWQVLLYPDNWDAVWQDYTKYSYTYGTPVGPSTFLYFTTDMVSHKDPM